jgi:cell wall-associated NlpC family hydrolase
VLILFILNSFFIFFEPSEKVLPGNEEIVEYAMQYLSDRKLIKVGKELDCSGFTRSVYKHFNIDLPHSSKDQFQLVECTDIEQMATGDLVFFKTNGKTISHVDIYICDNKFIHSPSKNERVRIDSLTQFYWKERFVCGGALKIINLN